LSSPTNEGFPLYVFVSTRGFAKKNQRGIRIAHSENRLRSIVRQVFASGASRDFIRQSQKLSGFGVKIVHRRESGGLMLLDG
jgi:hypothetical protein